MVAGQKSWALSELSTTSDGYFVLPELWDLNAGLSEDAPEIDGMRNVFAIAHNELGYESELGQASITLDRQGPVVVSATLMRTPLFAPAIEGTDDEVYFVYSDPLTGLPVGAEWVIFLDEEIATDEQSPTLKTTCKTDCKTTDHPLNFTFNKESSSAFTWQVIRNLKYTKNF